MKMKYIGKGKEFKKDMEYDVEIIGFRKAAVLIVQIGNGKEWIAERTYKSLAGLLRNWKG